MKSKIKNQKRCIKSKNNNLYIKIDELIKSAEIDKKFLLETKTKLIAKLSDINAQLMKNEGASLILKKLKEDK